MKIYGFTFINSDGLDDGRETFTELFISKEEMIDEAYNDYVCALDDFGTEDIDDDVLDEENFKNEIRRDGYVVAQYEDFHLQWETFEKEI